MTTEPLDLDGIERRARQYKRDSHDVQLLVAEVRRLQAYIDTQPFHSDIDDARRRVDQAEQALARVRELCDRREENDHKEAKLEPEDWQANRDWYFQRYGRMPDLKVKIEDIRRALDGGEAS